MSNSQDFVFGHGRDELLNRLFEANPGFNFDEPVNMVAGVIWLDQETGQRQADDYVLVTPALAIWLVQEITPTDPALHQAIEQEDDAAFNRLTAEQVFEAEFTSPEGPEYTELFPAIVRGQKIRLRVMNEREAEQLSFVYTVRADGTFITLPGSVPPRSVHELNV